MNNQPISHRLQYWTLKAASSVMRTFPMVRVDRILASVAGIIKYRDAVINKNLHIYDPDISDVSISKLKKSTYSIIGNMITELVRPIPRKAELTDSFATFLAEKNRKTTLVLHAHYGYWEQVGNLVSKNDANTNYTVYQPLSNKLIDRMLLERRESGTMTCLETSKFLKKLLDDIRRGKASSFYFLADHRPAPNHVSSIKQFFGTDARFDPFLGKICRKYEIDLVFVHQTIREDGTILVDGIHMDSSSNSPLEDYITLVEEQIRLDPSYYLWSHNRWKM